jgi:NAD(P)-dependent dehydrogenase (short-subunit alcohol dehydrogenase family)
VIAIVTGASGGIGVGIVEVLTEAGWTVIGFDTQPCPGFAGAALIEVDVSNGASVSTAVDRVTAEHGSPSALINNAAIGPIGTVLETDEATFDKIMSVNARGTFNTSRLVLPALISSGGGSIVNIGSGAGHGKANMAAYAASKAAVHALTMSMSRDHFADGVRVNTVIPGGGGIVSGISLERFGGSAADYARLPHRGSVAARPVEPNDVGEAVAFLLSDAAATISGTVIDLGCMAGQAGH